MTEWRDLPWIVRTDEIARMSAHAHAVAFEDAPRRLGMVEPRRSASASGYTIEHTWRVHDTIMKSDEFLTVTVEDTEGQCNFDVSSRYDGVDHDTTIRCSIDLLRPSIDDAAALLAIAVRMLHTAAIAEASDTAPPTMDGIEAVRLATMLGVDWSAPFEAIAHAASPLSPPLVVVNAPNGCVGMPDPRPDRTNATRLRVGMAGGIWLGPDHAVRECDGFDVMETLRIHRALEEAA